MHVLKTVSYIFWNEYGGLVIIVLCIRQAVESIGETEYQSNQAFQHHIRLQHHIQSKQLFE